jgi:hypothetical protein
MPGVTPLPQGRHRRVWPALGYTALVACGIVVSVGPAALAWRNGFMAWDPPYRSAVPVGDHLYNTYALWLWQHALKFGHSPWWDVFQFGAGGSSSHHPFGWPIVLIFLPVAAIAGPVAGYNAVCFFGFFAAAGATWLLVRELGLSRHAAAVAGFAFAFAPYRLVQSATHLNALLAWLLPLLLFFMERALTGPDDRRARLAAWAAAVVGVSVVGSGELHLAVFAALLIGGYAIARLPYSSRGRVRLLLLPGVALAAGTVTVGSLIYQMVLAPSVAAGGRGSEVAAHFAPRLADLARRTLQWDSFERYAYPGTVIALGACAGAIALFHRRRQRFFAVCLLAGIGLAWALAITPSMLEFPSLQSAYRLVPFLSFSRVPGRILIVSALLLAVLLAYAVDALSSGRWRSGVAAALIVGIMLDTPGGVFHYAAAGSGLPAPIPRDATVLDLPPFDHGHFSGSGYAFEIARTPAARVGGYTPFISAAAHRRQQSTVPLMSFDVDPCAWAAAIERLRIDHVVIHLDLFGDHRLQWDGDGAELADALVDRAGFAVKGADAHMIVLILGEGPPCARP